MKNNKKGFTLVELLAVIVILALIMGIAVVSIGGVLNSARQSTFKETAASIIQGVRQQMMLSNKLPSAATGDQTHYYGFKSTILDKVNELPMGGNIAFNTCTSGSFGNGSVCDLGKTAPSPTCGKASALSYVKVTYNVASQTYTYYICLMSDGTNPYIEETEEKTLLESNSTSMIKTGRVA